MTIYDLKLNEVYKVNEYCDYRRVPGGWVVTTISHGTNNMGQIIAFGMSSTFVPFSNEFESTLKAE